MFVKPERFDVTDINDLEMLFEKTHSMNPAKFSGKNRPDFFLTMVCSISFCLRYCIIRNNYMGYVLVWASLVGAWLWIAQFAKSSLWDFKSCKYPSTEISTCHKQLVHRFWEGLPNYLTLKALPAIPLFYYVLTVYDVFTPAVFTPANILKWNRC